MVLHGQSPGLKRFIIGLHLGNLVARKKRKDEKEAEEYEWIPPEFDEKAFLQKDMVGTKALMYSAVVAILFGALAATLGAPQHSPLAIFALGRTAGWLAHAIEQYAQNQLIRPRARYTGSPPR
jgi:citrate synthase